MVFEEHLDAFYEIFNNVMEQLDRLKGSHFESNYYPNVEPPDNVSPNKAYDLDKIRQNYPNAYMPWKEEDDERLVDEFHCGKTNSELAEIFQRNRGSIISRLKKLGLI